MLGCRIPPVCALCLVLLIASTARADSPSPPPQRFQVTSANGQYQAIADPHSGTEIREARTGELIWKKPGWHAAMHLSNDGQYLVTEYGTLLPLDFKPDFVVMTVWRKGAKFRSISIQEVVKDHRSLTRTASHFYWGRVISLSNDMIAEIELFDRATLKFPLLVH